MDIALKTSFHFDFFISMRNCQSDVALPLMKNLAVIKILARATLRMQSARRPLFRLSTERKRIGGWRWINSWGIDFRFNFGKMILVRLHSTRRFYRDHQTSKTAIRVSSRISHIFPCAVDFVDSRRETHERIERFFARRALSIAVIIKCYTSRAEKRQLTFLPKMNLLKIQTLLVTEYFTFQVLGEDCGILFDTLH